MACMAACRDATMEALPNLELPMYDPNYCLNCGLPYEPVERIADVSGIGDDGPEWVIFVEDEVCQCAAEDDDD